MGIFAGLHRPIREGDVGGVRPESDSQRRSSFVGICVDLRDHGSIALRLGGYDGVGRRVGRGCGDCLTWRFGG